MSIFRRRRQKLEISERDPQYHVKYLGNVLTAFMKGEGCVDRPTSILWENYKAHEATTGLDMQLTVCATGLKVVTKEQGLTEYRAHRISYCVCHPKYPHLFVWVYRHEGKKMKVEVRCHAVLCLTEAVAKSIAVHLHDKLAFALAEFTREKTRRQNSRLLLQRANSVPTGSTDLHGVPVRIKYLSVGQNFKLPSERSNTAPKLGAIAEGDETVSVAPTGAGSNNRWLSGALVARNGGGGGFEIDRVVEEEEEEEGEGVGMGRGRFGMGLRNDRGIEERAAMFDMAVVTNNTRGCLDGDVVKQRRLQTSSVSSDSSSDLDPTTTLTEDGSYDLEMGNDIDELKGDKKVQREIRKAAVAGLESSDDTDSIESGFSEQDAQDP